MNQPAASQVNVRALPAPPASQSDTATLRRRLLEILLAPAEPDSMSYAEFLAWADEDTLAEWKNGAVLMTSPASLLHQNLTLFLGQILSHFVEHHNLGVVIVPPFQMKLADSGREPDLLFVATAHLDRLQPTFLDGPADLVVEIVSPESGGRDRGDKFYEYAQGGVLEYWLLDPQRRWAEFYHLEDDHYRLVYAGAAGDYPCALLPGFRLRVEWLWQQPLPRVLDVIRQLGLL